MILSFALQSPTQNQIVIPVLQTLDTFLEGGVLDRLGGDEGGRKLYVLSRSTSPLFVCFLADDFGV